MCFCIFDSTLIEIFKQKHSIYKTILPAETEVSFDSVIFCKKRKAREGIAAPRYLGSFS